jgi:hypothetical protein
MDEMYIIIASKKTTRPVTREHLISAQKEELVLPCSKSFSVEEAENGNACNFIKA